MQLSICMMVKNEEENLKRCLDSIKNLLSQTKSELIIVDTGSTDDTVEIAKKYTDRLYFHKWNNNFSEMRNITIQYANADWIFVLDADEVLEDDSEIIQFLKQDNKKQSFNTLCLTVRNYIYKNNNTLFSDMLSPRFFRNDGEFHYESIVHNIPIYKEPVGRLAGTLHHYGYINDDLNMMEKKYHRTSALLNGALEKEPSNIYYRYQLSVSLAMYQKWEAAREEIIKVFMQLEAMPLIQRDSYFYVYGQLLMVHKHFEQYKEVITFAQKALEVRENDIDALFFMADAYISMGELLTAIPFLEKYLMLIEMYEKGELILTIDIKFETVGFKEKSIYNLLFIYNSEGHYEKVFELFRKYVNQGISDDSCEKLLEQLLEATIKSKKYLNLVTIYNDLSESYQTRLEKIMEENSALLDDEYQKELVSHLENVNGEFGKVNQIMFRLLVGEKTSDIFDKINLLDHKFDHYKDRMYFRYFYNNDNFRLFVSWLATIKIDQNCNSWNMIMDKNSYSVSWIIRNLGTFRPVSTIEKFIKVELEKYILLNVKSERTTQELLPLFKLYILDRYIFLQSIYNSDTLMEANWGDIENQEDIMILNLQAEKTSQGKDAINFMKNALKASGSFKLYVVELVNELKQKME